MNEQRSDDTQGVLALRQLLLRLVNPTFTLEISRFVDRDRTVVRPSRKKTLQTHPPSIRFICHTCRIRSVCFPCGTSEQIAHTTFFYNLHLQI